MSTCMQHTYFFKFVYVSSCLFIHTGTYNTHEFTRPVVVVSAWLFGLIDKAKVSKRNPHELSAQCLEFWGFRWFVAGLGVEGLGFGAWPASFKGAASVYVEIHSPKGPSTQIVGFQGPKTIQSMDLGT